ncbi:hypothetical protein NDU88_011309 [Pleurodeles waltl]|uniref:Uncharacterized protein n=1 Tax=Pleurodeles waltl TaxID=8319 RepID=A0AAV7S3U3_PLEWA|nr:hypothetical protein NDU88_011309 [Pleurodeles waltl]
MIPASAHLRRRPGRCVSIRVPAQHHPRGCNRILVRVSRDPVPTQVLQVSIPYQIGSSFLRSRTSLSDGPRGQASLLRASPPLDRALFSVRRGQGPISSPEYMRGTRGGSAHQPPQGKGAQDLLSSAAPGPGPGPGPQSLPRRPEPAPGAHLSRGAQPRAQRSSAPLGPVADATYQRPAVPAPPVPRSAPPARGPEHSTRLQQPQAPPTARLLVPRGRPEPRRLRSSLASGPDPLQGTFRRRISSDFSASGPAAPKDPQGVS